jgi:hypothetical protein
MESFLLVKAINVIPAVDIPSSEKKKQDEHQRRSGILPVGTVVFIHSLQSAEAKWINGLKGIVIDYNTESER